MNTALRRKTSAAAGNGLCTTIKYLQRTTSGAAATAGCNDQTLLCTTSGFAGNGLGATIKYLRAAAGIGLGATIKYQRGAAGIGLGSTAKYL
jgi:hypothetical protein